MLHPGSEDTDLPASYMPIFSF